MAKKLGRPPFEITPEVLKQVEDLASLGLTRDQIADYFGIARSTLYKHLAENSDFSDAVKRGQSKGVAIMANRLLEHAKNGSTSAAIFYLKCHGWKEANQLEVSTSQTGAGNADFYKTLGEELEKAKKK